MGGGDVTVVKGLITYFRILITQLRALITLLITRGAPPCTAPVKGGGGGGC